jgi:hypothetical protein
VQSLDLFALALLDGNLMKIGGQPVLEQKLIDLVFLGEGIEVHCSEHGKFISAGLLEPRSVGPRDGQRKGA